MICGAEGPETLPDFPTHLVLSPQVPEAGVLAFPWGRGNGFGLGITGAPSPSPIPFQMHIGCGTTGGASASQTPAPWVLGSVSTSHITPGLFSWLQLFSISKGALSVPKFPYTVFQREMTLTRLCMYSPCPAAPIVPYRNESGTAALSFQLR